MPDTQSSAGGQSSTATNASGSGAGSNATSGGTKKDPTEAIRSAAGEVRTAVEEAAGTTAKQASEVAGKVGDIARDAGERAMAFAEENKGLAARQIDGIHSAIEKAADELESKDQQQLAGYIRNIAGGLADFSKTLDEKGVNELAGTVGDFARRQPALFIGAAALIGFAASRFAMSSAKAATSGSSDEWSSDYNSGSYGRNSSSRDWSSGRNAAGQSGSASSNTWSSAGSASGASNRSTRNATDAIGSTGTTGGDF